MHTVELESTVLMDAIYGVDLHIMRLEGKVKAQQLEIEALNKELVDRDSKIIQESWNKVGRTISLILDHGEGKPPINEDMSLDTVLMLKHLHAALAKVNKAINRGDNIYQDILELEEYVNEAMEKAVEVSKKMNEGGGPDHDNSQ